MLLVQEELERVLMLLVQVVVVLVRSLYPQRTCPGNPAHTLQTRQDLQDNVLCIRARSHQGNHQTAEPELERVWWWHFGVKAVMVVMAAESGRELANWCRRHWQPVA